MPSPRTYFTKLCEQDGIAVNHPCGTWFVKRHLKEPKAKPAKLEVAAAHAWVYAHQRGTATGHDTSGWNVLPQVHLKYLISVCEHLFPLDGEEPCASAARYLDSVRPLARTPEDAALAAAALATAAALPLNPLLVQAVPGVMTGNAGQLTASAALSSTLLPAQSLTSVVPARKRKTDCLVHKHSVLWSLLPFTYGNIKHVPGPNLNQKLSNMGAWSEKDKNTFREKVMPFMVGGGEAQAHGYDERPPYTFMTALNMPLPDSSKTVDT
jgi:hypothetical protein